MQGAGCRLAKAKTLLLLCAVWNSTHWICSIVFHEFSGYFATKFISICSSPLTGRYAMMMTAYKYASCQQLAASSACHIRDTRYTIEIDGFGHTVPVPTPNNNVTCSILMQRRRAKPSHSKIQILTSVNDHFKPRNLFSGMNAPAHRRLCGRPIWFSAVATACASAEEQELRVFQIPLTYHHQRNEFLFKLPNSSVSN